MKVIYLSGVGSFLSDTLEEATKLTSKYSVFKNNNETKYRRYQTKKEYNAGSSELNQLVNILTYTPSKDNKPLTEEEKMELMKIEDPKQYYIITNGFDKKKTSKKSKRRKGIKKT